VKNKKTNPKEALDEKQQTEIQIILDVYRGFIKEVKDPRIAAVLTMSWSSLRP